MGNSNYSRNVFSNRDQTIENEAHTAEQLLTPASRGVQPKPQAKPMESSSLMVSWKKCFIKNRVSEPFCNCF